MQNGVDRFDEIEDYIKGNLDKENEVTFLERLKTDDILYQDFQLWTKLEQWFEEDTFSEIEAILDEEISNEKIFNSRVQNKRSIIFNQLFKIAACTLFLGLFIGIIYKQFYDISSMNGSFTYSKGLFINSNSGNTKLEGLSKYNISSIDWLIEAQEHNNDTTYQFIFDENIPKRILLRVPQIRYNFKDKMSINFIDSSNSYILKIDYKEFMLSPTKKWTKLKALPPKF